MPFLQRSNSGFNRPVTGPRFAIVPVVSQDDAPGHIARPGQRATIIAVMKVTNLHMTSGKEGVGGCGGSVGIGWVVVLGSGSLGGGGSGLPPMTSVRTPPDGTICPRLPCTLVADHGSSVSALRDDLRFVDVSFL